MYGKQQITTERENQIRTRTSNFVLNYYRHPTAWQTEATEG